MLTAVFLCCAKLIFLFLHESRLDFAVIRHQWHYLRLKRLFFHPVTPNAFQRVCDQRKNTTS